MTRFLISLHAAVPVALVAAMLLHLWPPAGLPPLAERPAWATWALIGLWLLLSTTATLLRGARLWRVALAAAGALLGVAVMSGVVLGAPLATAMGASLALLGAACAALAFIIGPARVQAARRGKPHGLAGAPSIRKRTAHGWRQRLATQAVHLPFWLTGALAVESFRLAHIVATGAARPSGMVGLLLACLIALPAATLRTWLPRTSALLWVLAALGYAGLAARAGLPQWMLAAALCTVVACGGLWERRMHRARRHGASP